MGTLKGKRALITGAAGGIGRATAEAFVAAGAAVMLVDLDEGPLAEVAAALGGTDVAHLAADVSDSAEMARCVRQCVDRLGGIDILFANAGIEGTIAPLTELSEEAFDRVQAVNTRGVWLGIKHAAPEIARGGGGSIIITSSVAGMIGAAGLGAYVASKHAVVGLMRSAALELAPLGIRVNSIHPGPIDNSMMRSIERQIDPQAPEGVQKAFEHDVPLGRYGTNLEIARLVRFLASDDSSYCTGSTFAADGGYLAR